MKDKIEQMIKDLEEYQSTLKGMETYDVSLEIVEAENILKRILKKI